MIAENIRKLFCCFIGGRPGCPKFLFFFLGALTSKPYAFQARPWEFSMVDSLDVHDSIGSNIFLSIRDNFVYRVLPRLNEDLNGIWISDRVRFSYDSLRNQRITKIYFPLSSSESAFTFGGGLLQYGHTYDWRSALFLFGRSFDFKNFSFFISDFIDYESLSVLKTVADGSVSSSASYFYLSNRNWFPLSFDFRATYLSPKISFFTNSDFFLFIGANVRVEAPILNLQIRKSTRLRSKPCVFFLGCDFNSNLNYISLGNSARTLRKILEGRHPVCMRLLFSQRPTFILGRGVTVRADFFSIHSMLLFFKARFLVHLSLVVLYEGMSALGALELGLFHNFPVFRNGPRLNYFFNYNDMDVSSSDYGSGVYLGQHFGVSSRKLPPFIFPTSSVYEKNGTHVNLEGRYQSATFGYSPPIVCRLDWKTIVMLFDFSVGVKSWGMYESVKDLLAFSSDIYGKGGYEIMDFYDPFVLPYFKIGNFRFFDYPFFPFSSNFYTKGVPTSRVMAVGSTGLDSKLRPQFRNRYELLR